MRAWIREREILVPLTPEGQFVYEGRPGFPGRCGRRIQRRKNVRTFPRAWVVGDVGIYQTPGYGTVRGPSRDLKVELVHLCSVYSY